MIELTAFEIFTDHFSSLRETSLDNSSVPPKYMTTSKLPAVNFDGVKKDYVKSLMITGSLKSNDALFDDGKGCLVFVEFKNGRIDSRLEFAIRKKVYDSVLIFIDITSMKLSDMRQCVKYILVYNETANKNKNLGEEVTEERKTAVQPSASFDAFAKNIGKYAKTEYVGFGLSIFQNYCFKEVHTYTTKEFENYLSTLESE